jgi:hypothetical protein
MNMSGWPDLNPPLTEEERTLIGQISVATREIGYCGEYNLEEFRQVIAVAIRITREQHSSSG